jgi:uncharacterized protein (DUF1330 family)
MAGIMVVKQRVTDIAQWKAVFNDPELETTRQKHGLYVTGTYRAADEPATVIVVMEMEDLERAKEFAQSDALAEARTKAGAVGFPDGVWYGESRVT